MKATFDMLHTLLSRGWTITANDQRLEFNGQWERILRYRSPVGWSGSEYQSRSGGRDFTPLDEFPPAVAEWIWQHIPMVAADAAREE